MTQPLFSGHSWDAEMLQRIYDAVQPIALEDLKLDVYANQLQVVSSDQMLDAYASVGMPYMYRHWSFGKRFAWDESQYRRGNTGLAYEIVINSDPCISYYMEENSAAMQALTVAHAAFGHNHFFKNNYLFKEWTDPSGILVYLQFASDYVAQCEEKHGLAAVERILDAAHALQSSGVFQARRAPPLSQEERQKRAVERRKYEAERYNELWYRTVPQSPIVYDQDEENGNGKTAAPHLPEENLLYFLEKYSPSLKAWEREILRIVRIVGQYFYPPRQTKMMNEGCATFVHYYITQMLWEKGLLTDGAYLEILHNHTNVILQIPWHHRLYSGINPYKLGFEMMMDIRRICEDPTGEDKEYLPIIAGCGDWRGVLKDAWANYRDDSFILQFLSPQLMRKLRLFAVSHQEGDDKLLVDHIHNARGFSEVRKSLADTYAVANRDPDIEITGADFRGNRLLTLRQNIKLGRTLHTKSALQTMAHLQTCWDYPIVMECATASGDIVSTFKIDDGTIHNK